MEPEGEPEHARDWLWFTVDQLASAYGWSKTHILEEVYVDEVMRLLPLIRKRKTIEYQMLLAIVQNPHTKKPKELWKILEAQIKEPTDEKIDRRGLEMLKQRMAGGKSIKVK